MKNLLLSLLLLISHAASAQPFLPHLDLSSLELGMPLSEVQEKLADSGCKQFGARFECRPSSEGRLINYLGEAVERVVLRFSSEDADVRFRFERDVFEKKGSVLTLVAVYPYANGVGTFASAIKKAYGGASKDIRTDSYWEKAFIWEINGGEMAWSSPDHPFVIYSGEYDILGRDPDFNY